jgi:hypothetical protein
MSYKAGKIISTTAIVPVNKLLSKPNAGSIFPSVYLSLSVTRIMCGASTVGSGSEWNQTLPTD